MRPGSPLCDAIKYRKNMEAGRHKKNGQLPLARDARRSIGQGEEQHPLRGIGDVDGLSLDAAVGKGGRNLHGIRPIVVGVAVLIKDIPPTTPQTAVSLF